MAKSMPGKWCSEAYDETPSLRRLLQTRTAEPKLFREIVRRLAELADMTVPTTEQAVMALHLLQSKETGEYAGKLHEHMLDGHLSADELDDLIREGTDVLELWAVTLRKLRAMREEADER